MKNGMCDVCGFEFGHLEGCPIPEGVPYAKELAKYLQDIEDELVYDGPPATHGRPIAWIVGF